MRPTDPYSLLEQYVDCVNRGGLKTMRPAYFGNNLAIGGKFSGQTSVTVGNEYANYLINDYPNIPQAIQAAIDDVFGRGGGEVVILAGTYNLPNPGNIITPKSGVTVRGQGKGATILKTARTDYVFKNPANSTISDFWVKDMTIDCQNLPNVNAMQILNATRCGCENVRFVNSAKWFVKIGSEPSGSTDGYCLDCRLINCDFENHSSIYEALLIYNAKNTWLQGLTFRNNAANSPCLGIWQKTDGLHVQDCIFENITEKAIYYGMTCHNIYIEHNEFINCGTGIQGGNVPDNGLFGETYTKNLHVNKNYFRGGPNSRTCVAVQYGGVDGCFADNNLIEGYERGFLFSYGNKTGLLTADFNSKNGRISNNTFKNMNPNNDLHALHAPFVFTNGSGVGLDFLDNKVIDDQTPKTLKHAISYNSIGATYAKMRFINNDLTVDPLGSVVKVNNSATIAATVQYRNNVGQDPSEFS